MDLCGLSQINDKQSHLAVTTNAMTKLYLINQTINKTTKTT